MRLIDADELKNLPFERMIHTDFGETAIPIEEIDNAQTVDFEKIGESLNCGIRAEYGGCDDCELSCPRNEVRRLIEEYSRPRGEWIDHSETDGYVECPFCGRLTTCEGNKEELHFCFNCGAAMKGGAE